MNNPIKEFWSFLKKDSWQSWLVSLILVVLLIKFVIFPALSFITSSSLPLVVVESCSMYHDSRFDGWWDKNAEWYELKGITKSEFEYFAYKNGVNKGDIIFVWGRSEYKVGDIVIFDPNPEAIAKNPIIHRAVSKNPISTKGDNNPEQLSLDNNIKRIDETSIPEERIIGKAVFKIPLLGWIKLIFFELLKSADQRGFCN